MSTPKAIVDARARLREAETALAVRERQRAEREAAKAPAVARLSAIRKRLGRTVVVISKPGQEYELTTLSTLSPGHYGEAGLGKAETRARYAKRLCANPTTAKVTLAGGAEFSPLTLPRKVRIPTAGDLRKVKAAERAWRKAVEAQVRAADALTAARQAAFDAGAKVTIEQVAADLAAIAEVNRAASGSMSAEYSAKWEIERAERARDDARRHLDHAVSRAKDPCPCSACATARANAKIAEERAAREKERARAEAAEARRVAKLPRIEFACPTYTAAESSGYGYEDPHEDGPDEDGNLWVTSPIETEGRGRKAIRMVECPDCQSRFNLSTVLSRPAGPAPGQQQLIAA